MQTENTPNTKIKTAADKRLDFMFPSLFFSLALIPMKHKGASLRIDTDFHFSYIRKMMVGLFRFFLYAIFAYVIYVFLRFLFSPQRPSRPRRSRPQLSGIMVKDEVCNTYLPKDEAILERTDGEDHYFCSQDCRKKFLEQRKSRS
jgi:uncharacterized protein